HNAAIGWRDVRERTDRKLTGAEWDEEQGRHDIFAGGKNVPLSKTAHNLVLDEVDLTRPNKPGMEGPKTAHEEKVMMRKLYHEMVLKQQQIKSDNGDKPVQIQGLGRKKDAAVVAV